MWSTAIILRLNTALLYWIFSAIFSYQAIRTAMILTFLSFFDHVSGI